MKRQQMRDAACSVLKEDWKDLLAKNGVTVSAGRFGVRSADRIVSSTSVSKDDDSPLFFFSLTMPDEEESTWQMCFGRIYDWSPAEFNDFLAKEPEERVGLAALAEDAAKEYKRHWWPTVIDEDYTVPPLDRGEEVHYLFSHTLEEKAKDVLPGCMIEGDCKIVGKDAHLAISAVVDVHGVEEVLCQQSKITGVMSWPLDRYAEEAPNQINVCCDHMLKRMELDAWKMVQTAENNRLNQRRRHYAQNEEAGMF